MGVGAFGVLAGGCPLWLVGGWVCGHGSCAGVSWHLGVDLGLWAGEQRRHKSSCLSVLTILSSLFHYFSDQFAFGEHFL